MRKNWFLGLLLVGAIALFATGSALAQVVLYGIDAQGNLFTIDVTTGAGTLVGVLPDGPWSNIELPGYNEIAIDRITGHGWAQQRDGNFAAQEFDPTTAAGIGAPINNDASWHGMEFIGGTLYAAGFAGPWAGGGDPRLAILNPATGAYSLIGPFGLLSQYAVVTGIAYDPSTGILYGIDGGRIGESTLYTIDRATGAATPVGPTGMSAGSLSFGPDGNLYAGGVANDQGNLFRIDTATGAGTFVGPTGFGTGEGNGISGLSLAGPLPRIPTLSTTGLAFLILMLLCAAMVFVPTRRLS